MPALALGAHSVPSFANAINPIAEKRRGMNEKPDAKPKPPNNTWMDGTVDIA